MPKEVDASGQISLGKKHAGWLPPGGYAQANEWARANRAALDQYAADIEANGTAAEQLRAFLQSTEADA